jgi:hypothetical protein
MMGDQVRQQNAKSEPHEKWTRRSVPGLHLDLLSAFDSGDFYDCTIRVGCDLQDANSTFKVRLRILHQQLKERRKCLFVGF